MPTQTKPAGYHSVTPYLIVRGAESAIAFYQKAFGAVELLRMPGSGGRLMHAEIKIVDSPVMLADENPEMEILGPESLGGSGAGFLIYVDDVDAFAKRAVEAGAVLKRPVQDHFYGDRAGTLLDPFGHQWTVATHLEEVSAQEMQLRLEKLHGESR